MSNRPRTIRGPWIPAAGWAALVAGLAAWPGLAYAQAAEQGQATPTVEEDPETRYQQQLERMPETVREVAIDEKLGQTIPLDLPFVDDLRRDVSLSDYFEGDVPVILTLNYYRCPKLCDVVLNAVGNATAEIGLTAGADYRIVTVSFDPAEGPGLAQANKRAMLDRLGDPAMSGAWHFLTGEQHNIDALAEAVGYRYKWLADQKLYAHPAAIMVLSPEGKITRYLYGVRYDPQTLRLSLVEASQGKVGSTLDRILLTCYHFDPEEGSYAWQAMNIMRAGGVLTVLALVIGIGAALWREHRRRRAGTEADPRGGVHPAHS